MTEKAKRRDKGMKKRTALPPPRDVVRAAVEAACVETGAYVNEIFKYRTWRDAGFLGGADRGWLSISRARVYAGLALRAIYEDTPVQNIAEMLNVPDPVNFFHNYDSQMQSQTKLRWFDDKAFMRVIEFIETYQKKREAELATSTRHLEMVTDSAGM